MFSNYSELFVLNFGVIRLQMYFMLEARTSVSDVCTFISDKNHNSFQPTITRYADCSHCGTLWHQHPESNWRSWSLFYSTSS